MLTRTLRTNPGLVSALALVSGFVLIVTEPLPLKVVGAILMLLAFFVPFIRMLVPDPDAANRSSTPDATDSAITAAEEPDPSGRSAGETVRMPQTHSRPPRKDPGAAD